MFVDYLTVMMVAVVAGAVLTIAYGLMFLQRVAMSLVYEPS
jgi:hypothetical protein